MSTPQEPSSEKTATLRKPVAIACKQWWIAAGIRAIKTMAQAAMGIIGAEAALTEVHWAVVGTAALMAGIMSLLNNLEGLPEVEL